MIELQSVTDVLKLLKVKYKGKSNMQVMLFFLFAEKEKR